MALKKSNKTQQVTELSFDSLADAIKTFEQDDNIEKRHLALESIVKFPDGSHKLVEYLRDESLDQKITSFIGMLLAKMNPKEAPIDDVMALLSLENAYIRNLAITTLQDYGDEIKYYIVKYLISDDRDLRILALNILGDVHFSESRDMMLELLEKEEDINVAMTAVDYLAEIGMPSDVDALEKLKERFKEDYYANFAIDRAINSIKG
jgi:HEAT repeat protein